jgi:tRNA(Ile)-lysidine synthetase-like protein
MDRVEIAFRRTALPLLPERGTWLVGVSGGGDSVALLSLLLRLSDGRPLRLVVAHLDHALRRGSGSDRRFVERMAASLRVECLSERRDVGALRRKSESPEEAARRVRRAFLLEAMERCGAGRIVLGHTLDDQAETVLMRLLRGAGPSSLAGMSIAGPGPFLRPLLGIERAELRGYLSRRRLPFREDPSNRSLRFDRNRVRRLVLPALWRTMNARAARHLVEAAARLREDAEALDALAEEHAGAITRARGGGITVDAKGLAALPRPLARRVARLSLVRGGVDPRRVTSRHIEALLHLATAPAGKKADLPDAVAASRKGGSIVLLRPPKAPARP